MLYKIFEVLIIYTALEGPSLELRGKHVEAPLHMQNKFRIKNLQLVACTVSGTKTK